MNIVREYSRGYPTFARCFDTKLSKVEFKAVMTLDLIQFNRIRQRQLDRMTTDSAYEGDTESSSEMEISEKHNPLRIRYQRRHSKYRRSRTS